MLNDILAGRVLARTSGVVIDVLLRMATGTNRPILLSNELLAQLISLAPGIVEQMVRRLGRVPKDTFVHVIDNNVCCC